MSRLGTTGAIAQAARFSDPLAGLEWLFKGIGLPVGAFQDFALTTPADTDADPFGGWVDENGSSFGNSVSTQQGDLKNISGRWAWRGDGVDDFLARTNLPLPGDFSIFVKQATTGDGILVGNNGTNQQLLRLGDAGNNRLSYYEGGTQYFSDTLSASRGVPNVIGIIKSGTTVTFYEGSTPRGSFSSPTPVSAGVIGAVIPGGPIGNPTTGDIYAVLIAEHDYTARLSGIVTALNAS